MNYTGRNMWYQDIINSYNYYAYKNSILLCYNTIKHCCADKKPFFLFGATAPQWAKASSFTRFLDHTQRGTTVGRTPLDEWSARRRDLYLTTHNIHKRQTSMPPAGFDPPIPASERPQTHALDRAATGTGIRNHYFH
jgi:hypothetical protein